MPSDKELVGLPIRPFLYTLDQISTLLSVPVSTLKGSYLHYKARSLGVRPPRKMEAVNISPEGQTPDWRVTEKELVRWMKLMGFRVYDRSYGN